MLLLIVHFSVFFCLNSFRSGVAATVLRNDYTAVRFGNFECHKNHRLSPTSEFYAGQTTKVASYMDCGLACIELEPCFSYNFGLTQDGDGKHVCELLSTDKYNSSDSFQMDVNFHHFSLRSPCSRSPCLSGRADRCIALYQEDDFHCVCRAGFVGKRCETYVLTVHIKAIGCDDPGVPNVDCNDGYGKSKIQLNGAEHSKQRRGHNIVVVNLDGTVYASKHFDTHGSSYSSSRMATFIDSLPQDKVVLVATQDSADSYSASSLRSVGAVNTAIHFRASWYLIGYKGDSKPWIQEGMKARYQGPSTVTVDLKLTVHV